MEHSSEIKQETSLNSFKNQLENGSHKIAHADFGKFILLVSVSLLSSHECREILLRVSFLLFFHWKDIGLFTLAH